MIDSGPEPMDTDDGGLRPVPVSPASSGRIGCSPAPPPGPIPRLPAISPEAGSSGDDKAMEDDEQ